MLSRKVAHLSLLLILAGCGIDAEGSLEGAAALGGSGGKGGSGGSAGSAGSVVFGGNGGDSGQSGAGQGGSSGKGGDGGKAGSAGSAPCQAPTDCEDGDPCTADACGDDKVCTHTIQQGASCDDGDKCNGVETCDAEGKCQPGTPPVVDDGKACTDDTCDPATGKVTNKVIPDCACESDADCKGNGCTTGTCKLSDTTGKNACFYTNDAAGKSCDDSDPCSTDDACDGGGNCKGVAVAVDDGNPCTTDSCNPATGDIIHTGNLGQPCSDGSLCTLDDQCDGTGKCSGFPVSIDDSDPCTEDICDPATGNIDHKGQNGCKKCTAETEATDCDDGNSCTVGTCVIDTCVFEDLPAGSDCNDGNGCTETDKCDASGKCSGSIKSVDDGDPCTKDLCDPATGAADHPPAPGQSCTDNDLCTLNDICNDQGKCVGITKNVDDGNACTDDTCDPATGNDAHSFKNGCKPCNKASDCDDGNDCTIEACTDGTCAYVNAPAGVGCNDNNPCTDADKCDGAGVCKGALVDTDDNDPCTADACNASTGVISHTPSSGASCTDNNPCTLGDTCLLGKCIGIDKNVDDGNACTTDSCDINTGNAVHVQQPNCAPCNSAADCPGNNPCVTKSCGANKKCAYANKADGSGCDDGNVCTQTDTCQTGVCTGSNPVVCTALDSCHKVGTCNPTTGACTNPIETNGKSCDDSDKCSQTDTCQNGTCTGSNPVVCQAQSQCHNVGTCDKATGVCSSPPKSNGTSCDDSNACTSGEKCDGAGVCKNGTQKDCTLPNTQCYTGTATCNSQTGACNYTKKNTGDACNDSKACTSTDTCKADGTCSGTVSCSSPPNTQCYDAAVAGVCDGSNNCSYTPKANGSSCNLDNNLCTVDTCNNGTCTAGTAKTCAPTCASGTAKTRKCDVATGDCVDDVTTPCVEKCAAGQYTAAGCDGTACKAAVPCQTGCAAGKLYSGSCDTNGTTCEAPTDCLTGCTLPNMNLDGSCNSNGNDCKPAAACDGSFKCKTDLSGCTTTCAGAGGTDTPCMFGFYCAADTDTSCTAKKANSASCGGNTECKSNSCVANVCVACTVMAGCAAPSTCNVATGFCE